MESCWDQAKDRPCTNKSPQHVSLPPCFPIHKHSLVFLLLSTHVWSWKAICKAEEATVPRGVG